MRCDVSGSVNWQSSSISFSGSGTTSDPYILTGSGVCNNEIYDSDTRPTEIRANLESTGARIVFSHTSLRLNGAIFDANGYTGNGAAIDLSGTDTLTFTVSQSRFILGLDNYVLLPALSDITFQVSGSDFTYTIGSWRCSDDTHIISSDITSSSGPVCYSGAITTSVGGAALQITGSGTMSTSKIGSVRSLSNKIDLSGAIGSVTITGAELRADGYTETGAMDYSIDLSGASSLTFGSGVTLNVGSGKKILLPPMSQVSGTVPSGSNLMGTISYSPEPTPCGELVGSSISTNVSCSGNIMDTVSPASSLTRTADLTSTGGKIDLSGSYTSISLNGGAVLTASSYTGSGAAIDLSGTTSLTFGNTDLNAGSNGYTLLPAISRISGFVPSSDITGGIWCFDQAYSVTSNISSINCYDDAITASTSSALTISSTLRSLSNKIDLSGATGSMTLGSGARLVADSYTESGSTDYSIDLSGASSLSFSSGVILDTGSSTKKILLPPMSQVSGTVPSGSNLMGTISYSPEPTPCGELVGSSISTNVSCSGNIMDTVSPASSLTRTADLTSTGGKIDLSGSYTSISLNGGAVLTASSYTGSGAAIDLSGTTSLTFGNTDLNAGSNGYTLLPAISRISGFVPSSDITGGIWCFDQAYSVTSNISSINCYDDAITASTSSALTISSTLRSLSNKIDLSGATGSMTLGSGARLVADSYTESGSTDYSIDLSGASSLSFSSGVILDTGSSTKKILLPPMSQVSGTVPSGSNLMGTISYSPEPTPCGELVGSSISTNVSCSGNIMDTVSPASSLTITADLTSTGGRIDLSNSYTSITLDGATLIASSYTGSGAAIDLSGANSLTFSGSASTLDASSAGYALLPASGSVTLTTAPTVTGALCYDQAYTITGNISSAHCYDDAITTNVAGTTLQITGSMRSLSNKIDLTGATGSIMITGVELRSDGYMETGATDYSIDLSGASNLTFGSGVTLNVGSGNKILLPPMSQVSGTVPSGGSLVGTISYSPEPTPCGELVGGTISTDVTCSGNIVDEVSRASSLTITADLTSTGGRIDLSGSYTSITLDGTTLSASGYTGSAAAIDLSGATSLIFTGSPSNFILGAGSYILLGAAASISIDETLEEEDNPFTLTTGSLLCLDEPYVVVEDVSDTSCYNGTITTNVGGTALQITALLRSLSNKIDLSGATGMITITGAELRADGYMETGVTDYSIDLSSAGNLTFGSGVTLNAGTGKILLPPMSQVSGTVPSGANLIGAIEYAADCELAYAGQTYSIDLTCSRNIIDQISRANILTITGDLTSNTGRIDLSGAYNLLTLDGGAILNAGSYTGTGAAIDLSGANSLNLANVNLDAGVNGYILLPQSSNVMNFVPSSDIVDGTYCYDQPYIVQRNISVLSCYNGAITTNVGGTALQITALLRSLSNKIDLSGATGMITITGAELRADGYMETGATDYSIDLSSAGSLTFGSGVTLNAGTGKILLPPMSQVSGTVPSGSSLIGSISYAIDPDADCELSGSIISAPVMCGGSIIDAISPVNSFTIMEDLTSSNGRINLSGSYTSLTLDNGAILTARSYTGTGAAIDLSGTSSLTFGNTNLDAGNGYILLPGRGITGFSPRTDVSEGTLFCYDKSNSYCPLDDVNSPDNRPGTSNAAFSQGGHFYPHCYSGDITASYGDRDLSIGVSIRSLSGRLDLTNSTGMVTIAQNSILRADGYTETGIDYSIDLSAASSLTFGSDVEFNVGQGKRVFLPHMSKISGVVPSGENLLGNILHAPDPSIDCELQYTGSTLSNDLICGGSVIDSVSTSNSLTIAGDLLSVSGIIDLSYSYASLIFVEAVNLKARGSVSSLYCKHMIDLSGAATLTFMGNNTLDAGISGCVVVPEMYNVDTSLVTVIGNVCNAGNFQISSFNPSIICIEGLITANISSTSTIIGDVVSLSNKIDFSGITQGIALGMSDDLFPEFSQPGYLISGYIGSGPSIDLSNVQFFRFEAGNILVLPGQYALLPARSAVSGQPAVTGGIACYDSTGIIGSISSGGVACYSNNITTSVGGVDLLIEGSIRSLSGMIDLTGATGAITLNGAVLDASGFNNSSAINLSGASTLVFTGTNVLNAGSSGSILLPSGFKISGAMPMFTGTPNYAIEQGDTFITATPITFPATAVGNITTSLANLVILGNVVSTEGTIDLSGVTGTLMVERAELDASNFSGEGFAIDLSAVEVLVFGEQVRLDAGDGLISLPSGFKISGTVPTFIGMPNYAMESGDYIIESTPVAFSSTATGTITTSLTTLIVSGNLASVTGRIDLIGARTSLTIDGVNLDASNYDGSGAAIDLSGTSSLTFTGSSSLDTGSGYALLPARSAVSGQPAVTGGIACYDSTGIIGSISSGGVACYSNNITTSVGGVDLLIEGSIRSLSGMIDLTGATGAITLNGAVLDASGFNNSSAINLSGASTLVFTGTNVLNAGSSGSILLPSGFKISGAMPMFTGTPNYAIEQGDTFITATPITFPATAVGNITTSLANLVILGNVVSTEGTIDLSGVTGTLMVERAELDASNFSGEGFAIDLSAVEALVFGEQVRLDAGDGLISLPSGFKISGTVPTFIGMPNYAMESGDYIIESTPVAFSSTATGTITTSLTTLIVSGNLASVTGRIDLIGARTSLTIDGVNLDASNYDGSGAAIDLSGTSSLTFTGSSSLNAGNGYVLFPVRESITGNPTQVVGRACYEGIGTVAQNIPLDDPIEGASFCYKDEINLSIGQVDISGEIWSLSGRIRFAESNATITLRDGAILRSGYQGSASEYSIDFSDIGRLICDNSNGSLDPESLFEVESGKKILFPEESKVEGCDFRRDYIDYTPSSEIQQPSNEDSSNPISAILPTVLAAVGALAFIGAIAGVGYYQYARLAGLDFNFDQDLDVHALMQDQFDVLEHNFADDAMLGDVDLLPVDELGGVMADPLMPFDPLGV